MGCEKTASFKIEHWMMREQIVMRVEVKKLCQTLPAVKVTTRSKSGTTFGITNQKVKQFEQLDDSNCGQLNLITGS